jgi:hypothetical protein
MQTKTGDNHPSTTTTHESFATGSITSKDGTTIGYRQLGQGPGVVVVHGTASSG